MKKYILLFIMLIPLYLKCEDSINIKKTYIEGLNRIPNNVILSKIYSYNINGYSIYKSDIKKIIKSIYMTKCFDKIKIDIENNNLIIKLKEKPILIEIENTGNHIIKNKFIKDFLKEKNIYLNEPLDGYNIFIIKNGLLNIYNDLGKLNTIINIEKIKCPLNKIKLKINFNEGNYSRINDIKILGNKNIHSITLLRKIKSYNYGLLLINRLIRPIYKRKEFILDLEIIKSFYKSRGFLNFKIKKKDIRFSDNKKNVFIDLFVDEGDKYNIKKSELIGNFNSIYFDDIKNILSKYFNKNFFDIEKIQKVKDDIKDFLLEKGYSYSNIDTKVIDIDKSNNSANLQFNISVGSKILVRNINIIGNNHTSDKIIRRQIHQAEYSLLNTKTLIEDLDRINKIRYFKYINIKTKKINNNEIDIFYSLEEIDFNGFKFGLNLNNKLNLYFNFSYVQDNFLGNGNLILFKSKYNNKNLNLELITENPFYIKNKKINIGSKMFYFNNNTKDQLYNILDNNYGISNIIKTNVNDNLFIKYKFIYNKYLYKIFNYNKDILSNVNYLNKIPFSVYNTLYFNRSILGNNEVKYLFKDYLISSNFNYDSLNNSNFPTEGKNLSFICKYTLPGSDNKYCSFKLLIENYYSDPLYTSLVLYNSTQIYYMNVFNKKKTPFYNYHYIDKINIVRGFSKELSDFNFVYLDYENEEVLDNDENMFNDTKILLKNELCIPSNTILGERYANIARLSCFLDVGLELKSKKIINDLYDIYDIYNYIYSKHTHMSTGFSLNFLSNIGIVKISYIIPIEKCSKLENIERFQFSIDKRW